MKNLSYEEGDFTLTSGKKSTFYIDCKDTTLNPEGMDLVGHLMYDEVRRIEGAEGVGGVSIGGVELEAGDYLFTEAGEEHDVCALADAEIFVSSQKATPVVEPASD